MSTTLQPTGGGSGKTEQSAVEVVRRPPLKKRKATVKASLKEALLQARYAPEASAGSDGDGGTAVPSFAVDGEFPTTLPLLRVVQSKKGSCGGDDSDANSGNSDSPAAESSSSASSLSPSASSAWAPSANRKTDGAAAAGGGGAAAAQEQEEQKDFLVTPPIVAEQAKALMALGEQARMGVAKPPWSTRPCETANASMQSG